MAASAAAATARALAAASAALATHQGRIDIILAGRAILAIRAVLAAYTVLASGHFFYIRTQYFYTRWRYFKIPPTLFCLQTGRQD